MLHVNMNENVTAHKTPERQATVQGKLSTGRFVRQSLATARTPGQMAGASSTSRRTITHHSEVVKRTTRFSREAVNAKRSKESETTRHQQPWQFREQVDDAVRQLCDERGRNKPDNLSFCLSVVDTYTMLIRYLDEIKVHWNPDDYEKCRLYVISETSALYHENLDEILNFFQDQANAGCGWMYADKLELVAKGFAALECEAHNATSHKAVLAKIWNLYLDQDLNYLEYLKGFPNVNYSARRTVENINRMISTWSPACTLELLSNESRERIAKQANSLYQEIIHSDINHSDAGEKKEDVAHKATDVMMEKRKCHDQLLDMLYNNESAEKADFHVGVDRDHKRLHYLKELFKLYEEYNKLVNDPATPLFRELNNLITPLVNEVQDKLKKCTYDHDQALRGEALLLVGHPEEEKWLSRECKDPCSGCAQSQRTVIPAVPENRITYERFHELATEIFLILESGNQDACMMVLGKIKQLRDYKSNSRQSSRNKARILERRLINIEDMAFVRLFASILEEYKHSRNTQDVEQRGEAMYCHKNKIIELNPYTFIIHHKKTRRTWRCAASAAWFNDLKPLRYQTSFTGDDIDNLLGLKDVALDLPLDKVENCLLTILTNLFQSMLQANPDTALIGKVTTLSEWIDHLDKRNKNVSRTLHEYNEQWREKYVSKVDEGATTSSDASATRMPSSVRPGILGAPPGVFDYHPRMGRQDVPSHTRQFSTHCPAVPAPAPYGSFRQSASSIPHRTPIARQPAARSRPILQPWLTVRPFLPRVPAPACNGVDFFHRPPVCGQIQPWRRQRAASQQQHGPRRPAMPFEYRSRYPFSSNIW